MADKKDPTLCVTCHTELPPNTQISYFSQEPLCPTKEDLSFWGEVLTMLRSMRALFDTIGYAENEGEDTDKELAKLGFEVADEAIQRMDLLRAAQNSWVKRYHDAEINHAVVIRE